jgi:predicted DNA-binding WGR domain protein
MPQTEHISLVNIDSSQNKWRSYSIHIVFPPSGSSIFKVICSWGRMNRHQRTLITEFSTADEMAIFIDSILKRRKRNGYQVIDRSDKFPSSPTLDNLPIAKGISIQMKLFS